MTGNMATRIFVSKLMAWIVFAILGLYFLISIDFKRATKIEEETGKKFNFVEKVWNSIKLPNLKLGIDLQGGTYLVVGVEVDKAITIRLNSELKTIDQLIKKSSITVLPTKKEVLDNNINFTFPDEESAKIFSNFLKKEVLYLKTSLDGFVVKSCLTSAEEQRIKIGSVEQALNVLNNRLLGFGVEGLSIQQHGDRQIVIQLPGVDDPERVKAVITKTAHLDFKIVEKVASSRQALLDDFDGDLPADKMIVPGKREKLDDEEGGRYYLVSSFSDLSGEHIIDARVGYGEYNRLEVQFKLDGPGASIFRELTENNIGKQLGIVIDDVMHTAATIQSAIGSSGRITGQGSPEESKDLALVLRSGALSAPLKFEQETRVGASLGQDAIKQGVMSCIVALLLVFLISMVYYKIPGIFAVLTLIYNMFLILLALSYFKSSLTLSGIAGMVLTIGMAIDASVLIYERVKEELLAGLPFRKGLIEGFKGARRVILDSNITTFISGVVLFSFGGPAVKGFAVTLMIGIISTIITGLFFLRAIFDFAFDALGAKEFKL